MTVITHTIVLRANGIPIIRWKRRGRKGLRVRIAKMLFAIGACAAGIQITMEA